MNLFSKLLKKSVGFYLAFMFFVNTASAVTIKAIYTSACERSIGMILDMDNRHITFLTINNGIKKIPRYEVIYLVDYPLDHLPTEKDFNIKEVPLVKVFSRINRRTELLLEGWPVGFNEEQIAFLNPTNNEVVIERKNIASLEYVFDAATVIKASQRHKIFKFIHPYAFRECKYNQQGPEIFPQQILSDPVQIKKNLDQLKLGFDRVRRYEREQDFYGVPEIYKNKTELGLWLSAGSRYGSSSKRSNNFLPALVDQYSSDIFDYQHQTVSGSAPLFIGTHEEPQSQVLYQFKASYFHFSGMFDPNSILIGSNYKWQKEDFNNNEQDSRHNDTTIIEAGFDYGGFDFKWYVISVIKLGLWDGSALARSTVNIPRLGLSYRTHGWDIEINGGSGNEALDDNIVGRAEMNFLRGNLNLENIFGLNWTLSVIKRDVEMLDGASVVQFSSSSMSETLYANYIFRKRFRTGVYVSHEDFSANALGNSRDDTFFKVGVSGYLSF